MATKPLSSAELREFENRFDFRFNETFRTWLLAHNAGFPSALELPTAKRKRTLTRVLDFSKNVHLLEAWDRNERCKEEIGATRVIFGVDNSGNFVCIERHYRHQQIVVWNHITGEFEPCLLDIPTFVRYGE